ncbi:hypothetical protein K5X82_03945 [Halosquirtibacter xylanolyticus]|uniref:hypothetical protein n=1 Tax=Halosquirtibacter xylanolyticus TaxID=3374599 RepID=UPI00374941A6|nr:hypothetical protein K5X82_03945 [Prolixibacteraceae bacterium]
MQIEIQDEQFYIGINWGAIHELGWFNSTYSIPVDLDIICYQIDENNQLVTTLKIDTNNIEWGELSEDDMSGDMNGNDHEDNEWILFKSSHIPQGNKLIIASINYTEQSLFRISHFDYRIYRGKTNNPDHIFYHKNIKKEIIIEDGSESFIIGVLSKENDRILFTPINKPSDHKESIGLFEEIVSLETTSQA